MYLQYVYPPGFTIEVREATTVSELKQQLARSFGHISVTRAALLRLTFAEHEVLPPARLVAI